MFFYKKEYPYALRGDFHIFAMFTISMQHHCGDANISMQSSGWGTQSKPHVLRIHKHQALSLVVFTMHALLGGHTHFIDASNLGRHRYHR